MTVPTAEDVIGYFTSLSNWGRWGTEDNLGTLNLITPEVRTAAAALVRTGRVVSLSRDIDPNGPPDPLGAGLGQVQRFMGIGEVSHHLGKGKSRFDGVTESVLIAAHGSNTHLDGLAHYSWEGKNYNGFSVDEHVTSLGGSSKLSVHHASEGIVTRGVLLDIAALKGVPWLEPGTAILPEDLLAAEERAGVTVRSGDALIIHTGHIARTLSEGVDPQRRQPGMHAACLPFLKDRDVAVLGGDCIHDVQPSGFDSFELLRPIHLVSLVALGLWLVDVMELTELAATCQEQERWEFFFAMLPWRMVGVTSSATNPIALF